MISWLLDTHALLWFAWGDPQLGAAARALIEDGSKRMVFSVASILAGALPPHHRDPFDRLLVAQSRIHSLVLVSADAVFDAYGVPRVW